MQHEKKQPEFQQEHSWFLQSNNTSANTVLSIKKFPKKNKTPVVPQPPTTLISLPTILFLFPKFKITVGMLGNMKTPLGSSY
jgi:hypothetical protein